MNTKRCILSILLCLSLLLTACAAPATTKPAPEGSSGTVTSDAAATDTPTDTTGDDTLTETSAKYFDPAIEGNLTEKPSIQDNYIGALGYDWYQSAQIPDGYAKWSSFDELTFNVKKDMIALLQSPNESIDQQKAGALFASAMDTETRDAAGNSTLMRTFYAIEATQSLEELSDLFASDGALYLYIPLIRTFVSADAQNSSVNLAALAPPALSLEDSAEYTQLTEQGERFKAANEKYYQALLTHNGVDKATATTMIADAYAFEEMLAPGIYPLETSYRDDYQELIYNVYTREELAALSPNFPLIDILDLSGFDHAKRFQVTEPDAYKKLNDIYTEENLANIKAYLMIHLLANMACFGDSFSANADIQWQNEKYGISGSKPQEEIAYGLCNSLIGELLGTIYAEQYFDEASKADIIDMIEEIKLVYKEHLNNADWLSEETRKTAFEKLDTMSLRIGYPEVYQIDWDAIQFEADTPFIENTMNCISLVLLQTNKQADQPVNLDLWIMNANTVNAGYMPSDNSINFPAAILRPPFYDPTASQSAKLGSIGAVIAHEITHAFDTTGSQYDKDGNLINWWTDEDRAAFKERTKTVSSYYSSIEVLEGEYVQGDLTIGETVADLGAISATLDIVRELEEPNYDDFFSAFATIWFEKCTPEYRVYNLKNDPHAPSYLRANVTFSQFQEFYDTYDIKEGDAMYVAPEDRLQVW